MCYICTGKGVGVEGFESIWPTCRACRSSRATSTPAASDAVSACRSRLAADAGLPPRLGRPRRGLRAQPRGPRRALLDLGDRHGRPRLHRRPGHPLEVEHYVEHLIAFLDAIGAERVQLSGESLGGWVATRAAIEQPRADRPPGPQHGRRLAGRPGGDGADPDALDGGGRKPRLGDGGARILWLMADKARSTTTSSPAARRSTAPGLRRRDGRHPGAAGPRDPCPQHRQPRGLRPDQGTDPGALDQRRPDRRRRRGPPHRLDDPRRRVRRDGGLRPLAPVRGPETSSTACTSTSCGRAHETSCVNPPRFEGRRRLP